MQVRIDELTGEHLVSLQEKLRTEEADRAAKANESQARLAQEVRESPTPSSSDSCGSGGERWLQLLDHRAHAPEVEGSGASRHAVTAAVAVTMAAASAIVGRHNHGRRHQHCS